MLTLYCWNGDENIIQIQSNIKPKIKDIEIEWYNLPGFAISRE